MSIVPSSCFTVSTYIVTDNGGAALAFISASGTDIEINTSDWALNASTETVKIEV